MAGHFVAELRATDPATFLTASYFFVMGPGISLPGDVYLQSGLVSWSAPSQKVTASAAGLVSQDEDQGQVVISNLADSVYAAGPLDGIIDFAWQGRQGSLWYFTDEAGWGARVLVDYGLVEQPVANMVRSSGATGDVVFPIRDRRAALNKPLQPTKFKGTNVSGQGVEGLPSDIMGKPKPYLVGRVQNIPGVLVNGSQFIYMLSNRYCTPTAVRDGGVALTLGTERIALIDLGLNTPSAGTFDYHRHNVNGTFVRLGSTPQYRVTMDGHQGVLADKTTRTHARIWQDMVLTAVFSGSPDPASVVAMDAIDSGEAGFWWGAEEITRKAALDEVLSSFSGFEVLGPDGLWRLKKLTVPTADTPSLSLELLGVNSRRLATTRTIISITKVRPNYTEGGAPAYRVNFNWGRNYQVMSPSDFAGAASQTLRDKFSQEYRTQTQTNLAIWNPDTESGLFPNAPEMGINTGYVDTSGAISTEGLAESNRLLTQYGAMRGQYTVEFVPRIWPTPDVVLVGDVHMITFPGMGLDTGKKFRVLQAGLNVDKDGPRMKVVLGLQA